MVLSCLPMGAQKLGFLAQRHAHVYSHVHTHILCMHMRTQRRWAGSVHGGGSTLASLLLWGSPGVGAGLGAWPGLHHQGLNCPRNWAPELGGETQTFGEPRNVLGSLLGFLHFVLFSGKQMGKKAPFPHFWRLLCVNRPAPITFRVKQRNSDRHRQLQPGARPRPTCPETASPAFRSLASAFLEEVCSVGTAGWHGPVSVSPGSPQGPGGGSQIGRAHV